MKPPVLWSAIVVSLLASIGLGVTAYFCGDYPRALLLSLTSVTLSLSIGLLVVNAFLNREEKRKAAVPLLRMIAPPITDFHNDYFIEEGRRRFGIPGLRAVIEAYQNNNRDPKALSPEQRGTLYQMIKDKRDTVLPLVGSIHDQLKEMSFILGWSFSPKMMRDSLDARLNIVKFKNLPFDDQEQTKLDACELFLDIDAGTGAIVRELANLLGLKDSQWLSKRPEA